MESKNLIGGLLAGAAIGVAVGILLAPATGKDTQKKIVKGSRKLVDDLQGSVEESIGSLRSRFNSGVDEAARKGKETINNTSERVKV